MIETSSVEEIFQKYGEMMYKLCIVMLKKRMMRKTRCKMH